MSIAQIAVLLVLSVVLSISLGHAATVTPPATMTPSIAVSSPVYTIGELGVGGSGCPPENVTTGTSPDGTGVSVIFRSFNVSTDVDNTRVRAACGIALPIHAQPGQSVGFFKVDFRGYVHVPNEPDAAAVLTNEYFFAGQQGIKVKHTYLPGDDKDIFDTNSIKFQSVIWSPCGGSTVFRVNTAVAATRLGASEVGASRDEVRIVLNSVDSAVKGSIQVAVASRACDPLTGEPI